MGAGVSANQLVGKSRTEMLKMCFEHLDKSDGEHDGNITLSNLMCMADELTPAEIENVRQDFVKMDRHNRNQVNLEEYIEYYTLQLADADDEEVRIFVGAVLNSTHWSQRALELP